MINTINQYLTKIDIIHIFNNLSMEQVTYYATGIVLVLLPILFRKLIATLINNRVKYLFKKFEIDNSSIERTYKSLNKPLSLLSYLVALTIFIKYFKIDQKSSSILFDLQDSMEIIIVFWFIHSSINLLGKHLRKLQKVFSKEMVEWLLKAIKLLIIFLGIATVLEAWGIKVAPLLAGLGLFGVAVALGAQDLFKNIIAGVLVMAEKRFESGEWIKVDGVVEGTVSTIGFRSTQIIRFDKAPVYVPNTKLSDNVVTNFSRMSHRQIKLTIGVLYSTKTEQIKQICDEINTYIQNNDDFAKEGVVTFVKMVEFNASSIDIQIYAFTKTTVWAEWLVIREDLQCKIKEVVENAGTGFAFPSRSMYIEQDNSKQIKTEKTNIEPTKK
jgi:MscS family membrane protein